ncbi:MAG: 3-dehydroquinate synthase [Terrimicrobiaceae bacterium]
MSVVEVGITERPYKVHVASGLLATCGDLVRQAMGTASKCVMISDSNVAALHGNGLKTALEAAGFEVVGFVVPAGESSKSMTRVSEACDMMIAAGLDRSSFVVALGGGVVGDLAGFVASVFYRGIPYVQVPTTVLAQVDSSVGGKTGVNAPGGKNLIGAFHHPALVLADVETLQTLPEREFNEGMAEVIKHGIIRDAALVRDAVNLARSHREELIIRNVKIKAGIVCKDPFEKSDLRALLNFGHTVGHAIEQVAGYGRFLHGEAISMGIAAALHLSSRLAGLPASDVHVVRGSLASLGLPLTIPADLEADRLLVAMSHDKKFHQGRIRFVLTKALGSAFVSDAVQESDLREAISACR